ncbi:hypothetical protein ACFFF5_10120 [Lederbergia wuyishanensis]|uniref:Uncharacterized protein n=1 Tax=Lederbergia wuyishanensis TaxID=1347903 RepID=A0ABU0D728_9BACI|nr:hypothetical protein [Lederbergia wuyishanensis]MDQ0344213.1 hypothetical protein [Lederbergia wuyishanensis]
MFNENSKIVQDYVLLIQNGLKTIDDVPNFHNLREVVSSVLDN